VEKPDLNIAWLINRSWPKLQNISKRLQTTFQTRNSWNSDI